MLSIGTLLFFVFLFFIARFYLSLKNYPPGPFPLPIIGNALQIVFHQYLGKTLPDIIYQWKKEYGNVITVWMGPQPTVCVLDYDLAMKTYVKNGEIFAGRQHNPILDELREGLGVIISEGDLWVEQRRFALHTLRDFGLGRNMMQGKILDEYHKRMDPLDVEIEKNGGKLLLDPKLKFLELMIGSIINRMLVGYSFDKNNIDEFTDIRRSLDEANNLFTFFDFVLMRPGLNSLPYLKQRHERMTKSHYNSMNFTKKQIHERKAAIKNGKYQLDEIAGPKDFLDSFLMEMRRREENGEELGTFNEKQLAYVIIDLWQTGMDTTIITLLWAILFMLKNPEVQEKMRKELLEVCGNDRDVELGDRPMLPYCNAAITEVHRQTALVTLNVPRTNTKDTEIGGFHVPKSTDNAVIMSVIFKDVDIFTNPDDFNPDRYLGEGGKEIEQKVIAFGIGKRSCLGEGLARAEVYLILLNIVKSYRIIDHENVPPHWKIGNPNSFSRLPADYECIFEKL